MDGVTVTGYEKPYVVWRDSSGNEGKSDIRKAHGKMPWRVDWAARWVIHGITCELRVRTTELLEGVMTPGFRYADYLVGTHRTKLSMSGSN